MRFFIMCGGLGKRLEDYSLPKPLNQIYGKPSIAYCLQNLPSHITVLHFIVAPHLAVYNFEQTIINLFKTRTCIFHWLPYFTRGPVESAWLGTLNISDERSGPVVFLDNDVLYRFPASLFEPHETAVLGYSEDTTGSEAYSFLTLSGDYVLNYKEKKRISNNFCCGVYGFRDLLQFREAAHRLLMAPSTTELFMSQIYEKFLMDGIPVRAIRFEGPILHIGSLRELRAAWPYLTRPCMRICFDLDNTLVTYPTVPGDYGTVHPVQSMVTLAQQLHSEGHTIIIHTARRMATHNYNVGAVIRDIATVTLKTLDDFGIPYDELIFGKPLADIYIDDRAVNPFHNSISSMGYIVAPKLQPPINSLPPNKYNTITTVGSHLIKKGPLEFLKGEIFYYNHLPVDSAIVRFFPRFYSSELYRDSNNATLTIENIPSIPFYSLYKECLITSRHIATLLEFVDMLHNIPPSTAYTDNVLPTSEECIANYNDKLRRRFAISSDYPYSDAAEIQAACLAGLEGHYPVIVPYIHGDLWFSNILIGYDNSLKVIDMRGRVGEHLTTGGDIYYDYGKILQSLLGYDAVLYGDTLPISYLSDMLSIFKAEISRRHISYKTVWNITFSLVIGTLHSITTEEKRHRVWHWIRQTFYNGEPE